MGLVALVALVACILYNRKFIKDNDDLFRGVDGINPVASRTSSNKRWVFNGTNVTDVTNVTDS